MMTFFLGTCPFGCLISQQNANTKLSFKDLQLRLERQSTWVQFLGWEDALEKEMATHSGVLAWKIPWTEEPGGLQSTGSQRVGHD